MCIRDRAQQGWVQVHAALRSDGASIGLIADLAVGCAPQGVEARTGGADLLQGLELGAPPDAFNPLGQAWGITSWSPLALHREGFAPFIRVLRAVMAGRGGLRIDHILVSEALKPTVTACVVDRAPRKNPQPSDHAPVVVTMSA